MFVMPEPELVDVVQGALVGAVRVDGTLTDTQAATLRAVGAVVGASADPDDVAGVGPDEAAAALTDPRLRRQTVQAMVVLAFLEHPPSEERLRTIRAYARAFGLHDDAVTAFGDWVHGHTHKMMFDTFRSMPIAEFELRYVHDEGFGPVARSLLAVVGKGSSPTLSARFEALEGCPDGSLGRKVWEMYQRHGWPFPGQPMSVPEATTEHDWVHVLAGYEPTPVGEVQVNSFIAAASTDDKAFGAVVLSLGLYEAGAFRLPSFPEKPDGSVMELPGAPEGLADSIRRGIAVNTDLMYGIDHWALANEQVDALRARFNVIPKDEPNPTTDPGA